ncbi:MAG: sigma-70 family RNA polymerase sigma factor [Lachnospiraceae bacterium]|nr:sigma-70 family RNA polymerase sigma factor [Lachnospiraceae bacterium]
MSDFEELYKKYYSQTYAYALKLCQNKEIAEEITQETFFKVLKKIDTYRGECKLSAWICQIAKNTYYSYIKKQNRLGDCPPEELAGQDNFEQAIIDKDMAMQIHKILHTLSEPYKEVFWMRIFGELSFAEIGKVHGKTEAWARVTYHRAKMKIMEEME